MKNGMSGLHLHFGGQFNEVGSEQHIWRKLKAFAYLFPSSGGAEKFLLEAIT